MFGSTVFFCYETGLYLNCHQHLSWLNCMQSCNNYSLICIKTFPFNTTWTVFIKQIKNKENMHITIDLISLCQGMLYTGKPRKLRNTSVCWARKTSATNLTIVEFWPHLVAQTCKFPVQRTKIPFCSFQNLLRYICKPLNID